VFSACLSFPEHQDDYDADYCDCDYDAGYGGHKVQVSHRSRLWRRLRSSNRSFFNYKKRFQRTNHSSFQNQQMKRRHRLEKVEEKCTKCGVCKRVCPTQVTEVYEKKGGDVTVSNCLLCMRCVEMCPYEDTLKVKVAGKTVFKSRNWLE
jgi:formate hydrogenlyase subunit 6/NADH:ubiquinone oxidoreductase subunit I